MEKFKIVKDSEKKLVELKETACICIVVEGKTIAQITDDGTLHTYKHTLERLGMKLNPNA